MDIEEIALEYSWKSTRSGRIREKQKRALFLGLNHRLLKKLESCQNECIPLIFDGSKWLSVKKPCSI